MLAYQKPNPNPQTTKTSVIRSIICDKTCAMRTESR